MEVWATTASIVINEGRWAEEEFMERRGEEKLRELVWQKMIIK